MDPMNNKHFLLLISFGFLVLGMQNKMEAATTSSTSEESYSGIDANLAKDIQISDEHVNIMNIDVIRMRAMFNRTPRRQPNPVADLRLLQACLRCNLQAAEYAIIEGADVNTTDKDGYTPLVCACVGWDFKIVELLLLHDANVNVVIKKNGYTPLMYACSLKKKNHHIIKILLAHGAEVNASTKTGQTPLQLACMTRYPPNTISMLITYGANVNASDINYRTPLFWAYSHGDLLVENMLIDAGAYVLTDCIPSWFIRSAQINLHKQKSIQTDTKKIKGKKLKTE